MKNSDYNRYITHRQKLIYSWKDCISCDHFIYSALPHAQLGALRPLPPFAAAGVLIDSYRQIYLSIIVFLCIDHLF